jgi:post-segregation antitoxin (ccd killing protein)
MLHSENAPKKATNLSLSVATLEKARELGMNLSKTVDELLEKEVRRVYRAQWMERNKAAIAPSDPSTKTSCAMCTNTGRAQDRPHRHRHAQRVRPPDALRPERGLSAGDHQEGAPALHHPGAAVVPDAARPATTGCRSAAVSIWDEWARPTATWARSTACSGAAGRRPTAATSTRSPEVIQTLKTNPDSRRIIVSAWNVADLDKMALMPCHAFFQFYVAEGRGGSAASSTSAAPTSSWACPSTSPATRC